MIIVTLNLPVLYLRPNLFQKDGSIYEEYIYKKIDYSKDHAERYFMQDFKRRYNKFVHHLETNYNSSSLNAFHANGISTSYKKISNSEQATNWVKMVHRSMKYFNSPAYPLFYND
jgi:hypothetical protein